VVQRSPAITLAPEVAEALDASEEAEGGAAHDDRGMCSHGRVFGGLDAADADAGEHEPWQQRRPGGGVVGEADVCDGEGDDTQGQDPGDTTRSVLRPAPRLVRVAVAL